MKALKNTSLALLSTLIMTTQSSVSDVLTEVQLHATLGVVTNFILNDEIITHNGTSYGVVTSPYTGRVWLDRNLGADRVCTSFDDALCYGDYYQWGRNHDGHEESNSSTISTQASDVGSAGHGDYIVGNTDWASTDSNGSTRSVNWSQTDGSSVCPAGFRVPNMTELKAETLDENVINSDTAFANFLKLPSAGSRSGFDGAIYINSEGLVWASSVDSVVSDALRFNSGGAIDSTQRRASGFSVRCLRD